MSAARLGATSLCAALAFFLVAAPARAQSLDRLFFTAEQRAALDARRNARIPEKSAPAAAVAAPTTRIDGYVRRSGGLSTVWVNGESMQENAADSPRLPRGSSDARVSVVVGESGSRRELKPGEVLDRATGEVRDVIGDGEIKVRRSAR